MKVVKFGGSSMADAGQYRKVRDILLADPERRVVVVSAAGKRNKADHKITDLLYLCYAHTQYGVDCSGVFEMIVSRYREIQQELGLTLDLEPEFAALKPKERKEIPECKAAADQIAAVAEKSVAELRDKLDSEYKSAAAEAFPDEDIFMAIADDIGFDATGKPTKVNELDEIGAELAKFISKERGDE